MPQRLDGFAVPERCWDIDIAVWGLQVLPCPSLDELCLDTTQEEQNERRKKAKHRCDVQREEVCLTPFCMLNCRLITSTKLCPGMVRCRTFCNNLDKGCAQWRDVSPALRIPSPVRLVAAQYTCRLPRYHTEEEPHMVAKTESNCYSIDQRRAYARWDQANVGRVHGWPCRWWL